MAGEVQTVSYNSMFTRIDGKLSLYVFIHIYICMCDMCKLMHLLCKYSVKVHYYI